LNWGGKLSLIKNEMMLLKLTSLMIIIMTTVAIQTLIVTSPAFTNNGSIPARYTCNGEGTNPELNIENIPAEAKTLALIVEDPDAANGTFVHWVMWNIPVKGLIPANNAPGMQGKNSNNENKYKAPCPPSGNHHYRFKFYALDTKLDLLLSTDKEGLLKAMAGHIVAEGELTGMYMK